MWRFVATALAFLVGACRGEEAPKPTDAPPTTATQAEAPTTPTPAEPAPQAKGADHRWTVADIGQLPPVAPTRVAQTPVPMAPDPLWDRTMTRLAAVVDEYAGDPDNPWAIGHGIMARGLDFHLRDGRPAVPYMFEHFAEEFPAGSHTLVRFPRGTDKKRVEPHTDQLLKILEEAGIDPDRVVTVQGHAHLVADLYRGAVIKSYLAPLRNEASYTSTNDLPWSLNALALWAGPSLRWEALDGSPMNLDAFTDYTVAVLQQETAFMADAMKAGADFEKTGQGIFNYTCGGAHLLQGAAFAVAQGRGSPKNREVIEAQVPLMFYRLPRELRIYDETLDDNPEHKVRLLVQRLKFTGHYLETMHKLAMLGFYAPDEEQQRLLQGTAKQIALVTEALAQEGVYARVLELREQDYQLYLDVVGDSAHALRALELALGKAPIRY